MQSKSQKDTSDSKRVVVWVDNNIFSTIKKLGKTVLDIFSGDSIRLITLNGIVDVKKFFKHLFMIRYKQRTEEHLRKYCIIFFNDFKRMRDILEYKEVVEYFKDNDLQITTAVFADSIDKTTLSILSKLDSHFTLLSTRATLQEFIKDPEQNQAARLTNTDYIDSDNEQTMLD